MDEEFYFKLVNYTRKISYSRTIEFLTKNYKSARKVDGLVESMDAATLQGLFVGFF